MQFWSFAIVLLAVSRALAAPVAQDPSWQVQEPAVTKTVDVSTTRDPSLPTLPTLPTLATLKPFSFETLKPVSIQTLKPFSFETLKPVSFQTLKPFSLETIKPFSLETPKPFSLETLKPFSLETLKPFTLPTTETTTIVPSTPIVPSTVLPIRHKREEGWELTEKPTTVEVTTKGFSSPLPILPAITTLKPLSKIETPKPFSLETPKPFSLETIKPFSFQTLKPFSLETIKPFSMETPKPFSLETIKPFTLFPTTESTMIVPSTVLPIRHKREEGWELTEKPTTVEVTTKGSSPLPILPAITTLKPVSKIETPKPFSLETPKPFSLETIKPFSFQTLKPFSLETIKPFTLFPTTGSTTIVPSVLPIRHKRDETWSLNEKPTHMEVTTKRSKIETIEPITTKPIVGTRFPNTETTKVREVTEPLPKETTKFREVTEPLPKKETTKSREVTEPLSKETTKFREVTEPMRKETTKFREVAEPMRKETTKFREVTDEPTHFSTKPLRKERKETTKFREVTDEPTRFPTMKPLQMTTFHEVTDERTKMDMSTRFPMTKPMPMLPTLETLKPINFSPVTVKPFTLFPTTETKFPPTQLSIRHKRQMPDGQPGWELLEMPSAFDLTNAPTNDVTTSDFASSDDEDSAMHFANTDFSRISGMPVGLTTGFSADETTTIMDVSSTTTPIPH